MCTRIARAAVSLIAVGVRSPILAREISADGFHRWMVAVAARQLFNACARIHVDDRA